MRNKYVSHKDNVRFVILFCIFTSNLRFFLFFLFTACFFPFSTFSDIFNTINDFLDIFAIDDLYFIKTKNGWLNFIIRLCSLIIECLRKNMERTNLERTNLNQTNPKSLFMHSMRKFLNIPKSNRQYCRIIVFFFFSFQDS